MRFGMHFPVRLSGLRSAGLIFLDRSRKNELAIGALQQKALTGPELHNTRSKIMHDSMCSGADERQMWCVS